MKIRITLATTLLMLTTAGCMTIHKKSPKPEPTPNPDMMTVTLTPKELADSFEYRDNKISQQLDQLRLQFEDIQKKITTLKNQIQKQVSDCLCPGEMK